jgi:hypothetical protein
MTEPQSSRYELILSLLKPIAARRVPVQKKTLRDWADDTVQARGKEQSMWSTGLRPEATAAAKF